MSELPYPGRFVWQDLMTANVEAAKVFYGGLFGWTFEHFDRGDGYGYWLICHQGERIGGLSLLAEQNRPAIWIPAITTNDVDDFCLRATDMGATVHREPRDVPGIGRMAVVSDPQGGTFFPMTEQERTDGSLPTVGPGHGAWRQLVTTDPPAATAFYTRMFGWTSRVMGTDGDLRKFLVYQDMTVAGIGKKPDGLSDTTWVLSFEVENIDTSSQRVTELGGRIVVPAKPVESVGRISWVADATGVLLALVQPAPRANEPVHAQMDALQEQLITSNRSMP